MKRTTLATALFLALMAPASAMQCDLVKWAVEAFGEPAALQWAKSKGWTPSQIESAKRCLVKVAGKK